MKQSALFFSLVAVLLAGCAGSPGYQPRYFLLDPGTLSDVALAQPQHTAAVNFVDVAMPFAGDNFVYKITGVEWESDPYHLFLVSPAEMMTSIVRNRVSRSGLFKDVVIPGSGVRADYQIDVEVRELYGDFMTPSKPVAVLAMDVEVVKRMNGESVVVLRKRFSETVPIGEKTALSLVEAWNMALRRNLDRMMRALAKDVKGA